MAHANDQILDSSATPARLVLGTRQTYSAVAVSYTHLTLPTIYSV